jgi:hypothetical protein
MYRGHLQLAGQGLPRAQGALFARDGMPLQDEHAEVSGDGFRAQPGTLFSSEYTVILIKFTS